MSPSSVPPLVRGVTLALILGLSAVERTRALRELPVHMAIGVVLVLSLWTIAVLGLVSRVKVPLAILALVWGCLVLWLGMNQMPHVRQSTARDRSDASHLLVGLAAVGIGETLAGAILATRRAPASQA